MSNSLQPQRQCFLAPHPWDSPGKNTGMGCHALLQGYFPTQRSNPSLLCLLNCSGFFTTEPTVKPLTSLVIYPLHCDGKWDHFVTISFWYFVVGIQKWNMKNDFLQHFVLAKSEYGVIECTLKQYKLWHMLKYIHNSGSCTMFILYPLLTFRLYIYV